jgi:hypothetical protein
MLISSFGCSAKTAALEFAFANGKNIKNGDNLAHHLIQSFSPNEVSFDEAHKIGMELADRLLGGKHSYVIATHIEKEHVHNHIIFCATDNISGHKYNSCRKSYYNIRSISDKLCDEHNLSVISPSGKRGKKREEWSAQRQGKSWKEKLRRDIDATIKLSNSYGDFIRLMRLKGYEIKGDELDGSLKYISFRPSGKERFVRGSAKSLGEEYTRENIKLRIEAKHRQRTDFKQRDYSERRLIDTSQDKFAESPGLKHWADIENLKIAASTYAKANSITELEANIASRKSLANESRLELVSLEHDMKKAAEILKYAQQYHATKQFQINYRKSKNPDEYLRRYESKLILHDGAKNVLKRYGVNIKNLDIGQLKNGFHEMELKKANLQKTFKSAEKEAFEMEKKLQNLNSYLGIENGHKHTAQSNSKDHSL